MSNIYCVVFLFSLFSSCVTYYANFSGLSIFYCTFGIVYSGVQHILCCVILCLVYSLLPVFLECPFCLHLPFSLTFINVLTEENV